MIGLASPRVRRAGAGGLLALMACSGAPRPGPLMAAGPGPALVYSRRVASSQAIFWIPASGGPERRLTEGRATDGLPRFTRDGRNVVFSSNRTGNWQIWEVPAGGGPARRLRANGHRELEADPSPDGTQLAFLSDQGQAQSLWVLDIASGKERLLVRHGEDSVLGNPQWSPDGRRIVFSSNWHFGHQIYIADVVTGAQTRLSGLLAGGCEPRFSVDGRKVIHVTRGHHLPTSRLVEHDLLTGAARVLVAWPALNYDPVYSPDGTEIAFSSNLTGEWQVYRQRLSDGKAWQVTSGPGAARDPDYLPVLSSTE